MVESIFTEKGLGAEVTVSGDPTVALFSESQSRFVVTVKKKDQVSFERVMSDAIVIGHVTADNLLTIKQNNEPIIQEQIDQLSNLWEEAIPKIGRASCRERRR